MPVPVDRAEDCTVRFKPSQPRKISKAPASLQSFLLYGQRSSAHRYRHVWIWFHLAQLSLALPPWNLASKSIVFEHVKPLLRDGGVIFGSTILGEGVRHNPLAKQLMKIYNAKGIFSNLSDRHSDLEAGLKAHFDEHTIHIAGCVALFSAKRRMARTVTGDCPAVSAEVPRQIHDCLPS
jgi:hypothetical protein